MIRVFCKELPYFLSQELFNEYKSQEKELNFLLKTYPDTYRWIDDLESIKWLMASAIFYRRVLAPLEGAHAFLRDRSVLDISQVKIGDYILDRGEANMLNEVTNRFTSLLGYFGISTGLFDYENVEQFLRQTKRYYKNVIDNEKEI